MAQRIFDIKRNSVQTTDATQTTLTSFTIPSNSGAMVTSRITLRNTTGHDTASLAIVGVFKNSAGTTTLEGAVTSTLAILGSTGLLTATATMDVSSGTIRVRVTGIIATTIDWQDKTEIINN